ncbi:hypothetical protein Dimus_038637 [Dionaea muscipula]
MEPFLLKQGMPVRLNKGVVELVVDYVVCQAGNPLSPESARILRLLGIKMATFKLSLFAVNKPTLPKDRPDGRRPMDNIYSNRWSNDEFELYREVLDESGIESS